MRKTRFLLFFLAAFTVLIVNACTHNTAQLEGQETSATTMSAATKVVEDAFGSVEVPLHPQRIVVLDDHTFLDPVLALGIKPVGVVSCAPICLEPFRGIPNELVADIPDVGINAMEPSLEKIINLNPDLILANELNEKIYEQLTAIAPTVLSDYYKIADFKERLQHFAQILGREDQVENILAQYEERIQKLRQQLGTKIETKTISILYFYNSQIVASRESLTHYQVLSDVGLQFTQAHQNVGTSWNPLSLEALPDYDADYLFLITSDESLSFLEQPVWSTLKAVQNNQIHAVKWDVGGPIGANRVIDDLYKYLVSDA
ncbi:MAG: iron-siderophore ABC transporter substrate-binding protein [Leptolyngbya sp. SIO1E4]|nr:iron-siderophore ABC transporter substrate-binding protein [Leptolyngbya sp. SIO1E4]